MEEEKESHSIVLRESEDNDFAFIMNSWLTSYRESSEFAKHIPKQIYFKYHHQIVDQILKRRSTTVIVAVNSDEKDLIYGYAVFEVLNKTQIVHYIYVKRAFGNFGISKALTDNAPFFVGQDTYASHATNKGQKIIDRLNLVYCPYLLWVCMILETNSLVATNRF